MKVMLGHDGPPTTYPTNLITGEKFARCPRRELLEADPDVAAEVDRMGGTLYRMFRRGHLLEDGGLGEQPALYVDYMERIDSLSKIVEAKRQAGDQGDGEE